MGYEHWIVEADPSNRKVLLRHIATSIRMSYPLLALLVSIPTSIIALLDSSSIKYINSYGERLG